MPPTVIDLCSSPEPDDTPETAAKTALDTFRPRKKKDHRDSNSREERAVHNGQPPSEAGRVVLKGFEPMKQKIPVNGSEKRPNPTSWAPLASHLDEARDELARVRAKQDATERNALKKHAAPADVIPARKAHNGSLASLLQQEAEKYSPARITKSSGGSTAVKDSRNHTPKRLSMPAPQAERTQVKDSAQHKQLNGNHVQPQLNVSDRNVKPRPSFSTVVASPLLAIHKDSNGQSSQRIDKPHQDESYPRYGLHAAQPFKRRRIEIPSMSHAHPSHGNSHRAQAGGVPPQRQVATMPIRSVSPIVAVSSPLFGDPAHRAESTPTTSERFLTPGSRPVSQKGIASPALSSAGDARPTTNISQSDARLKHSSSAQSEQLDESQRDLAEAPQAKSKLMHNASRSRNQSVAKPSNSSPTPASVRESPKAGLTMVPAVAPKPNANLTNSHGDPYTPEEDALLKKLKEVDNLGWEEISRHFDGRRTYGSLQVRYSSKLKWRPQRASPGRSKALSAKPVSTLARVREVRSTSPESDALARRPRKRRNNEAAAVSGFISWADVKNQRLAEQIEPEAQATTPIADMDSRQFESDRAYPKSLLRILRQRELGTDSGRGWAPKCRTTPDELKERVFDDIGPRMFYKGTSGDVTCLAWSPDGDAFAAGSIAITDERSMQYNRPNNLLFGRLHQSTLQELPEHHLERPKICGPGNVNGLASMRETQDPRLFMTVASVQFSPDGRILYSAGSDRKVRAYEVGNRQVACSYELEHAEPLDLLSVSNNHLLATACHSAANGSVGIYQGQHRQLSLSPSRVDEQTQRAIYPCALKWGTAHRHSNLLLAGFSIDSVDEERNIAGETCLWDIRQEALLVKISGITRNVFDVAWNPSPSSTSTHFAVASARGTGKVSKGTRSVVQCFTPHQTGARRAIEWECPAFDINDVVYCQHDDNLVAVGATDGMVYVWDQRFADRSNRPLHTLLHGETLNVLDHDREREIADTGVRFLSWGATSTRLYSGSSDGVVKVWNTHKSNEDAHVKDIATFGSAVMSGAFSPDYRDLLIGEDQGRINALSVGYEHKAVRSMYRFELQSAASPNVEEDRFAAACELVATGQVALRPMGDLPIRQAVQGRNYNGPYLRPSTSEIVDAQDQYQVALNFQNEADLAPSSGTDDRETQLREANKRVQQAQERIVHLQSRLDDSVKLQPLAKANQRAMVRAAEKRVELEVSEPTEHCKLACNYLPSVAEDDEVPDSRRSELRIPGTLRSRPPPGTADSAEEDLVEAGLVYKCMSCLGPAEKPRSGKNPLCANCQHTRLGLTASCELCSAPIRKSSDTASGVCERCSFACFRCGRPSLVKRDTSLIKCDTCILSWKIGVLGYELVRRGSKQFTESNGSEPYGTKVRDEAPPETFGARDIEHHHSRWE